MPSSILVVALNPSIDVEWEVDDVRWEEKNSIRSERRWAGGKGVNVARWLRHLHAKPRLLLPLGGRNGEELANGLKSERLQFEVVSLREETRANIIVTTVNGGQMRFNPGGPSVSPREWNTFVTRFRRQMREAELVVLSGSLPRTMHPSAYAELLAIAGKANIKCLLDCDGAAFVKAIRAKPFIVKPNLHELEQWCGAPLRGTKAIMKAAAALSDATQGWALISLGEKGGLLLNVKAGEAYETRAPRRKAVNTVGAGDGMVAAIANAIVAGLFPTDWLRGGVACGSAAVSYPAGVLAPAVSIARLRKQVHPKSVPCPAK